MFGLDHSQMHPGALAEQYIQDAVIPSVMEGLGHVLQKQPAHPVAALTQYLKDHNIRRPTTRTEMTSDMIGDIEFHSKEGLLDRETQLPKHFIKSGDCPVWALELPPRGELTHIAAQLADEEKVEHILWVVAGMDDLQCYVEHSPSRSALSSGQWHKAQLLGASRPSSQQSECMSPNPRTNTRLSADVHEDPTSEDRPPSSRRLSVAGSMGEPAAPPAPIWSEEPEELLAGYDVPFFRTDKFTALEEKIIESIRPIRVHDTIDTVLHGGIVVEGKSHEISAEVTTDVLRNASLDAGFKSIKAVRFQHPSGVPVTLDVYDRLTEILDSVTEPNSAVVIVSADRWKLVQHITTMATLYFRTQRNAQQLRRTINVLDHQLQAEKEVDIDEHHDNVLFRQRARDETRKHLLRSHQALLEDTDDMDDDVAIEAREQATKARLQRRAKQSQRRLDIMQKANTGAATRMQSIFRGHQARKKNQNAEIRDRVQGRTPQEVDDLLSKGRFPLVELCQTTLMDTFGDSQFMTTAPRKVQSKPVRVWNVAVSRIEPANTCDVSSEEEVWTSKTVDKVRINVSSATNPLHDVDSVLAMLENDDVSYMYRTFRNYSGIPAVQRRAYATLERMVHHVMYAAYLSFHHKKKCQDGLFTIKAASIMRVPGSVQGLTHFSEFVKKHPLVKDCLNHPQFSTYFLSNVPAPMSHQRVLVANDPAKFGAFLEGTCAANTGGVHETPQNSVHHQLHHAAPIFWVPDCLTTDQWTETAASIVKSTPKCRRVLWISSRPDFTTYVNGTPFFSCNRMESHGHGVDLPSACTVNNTMIVDASLPYTEMHAAMDREKFFHPISLLPKVNALAFNKMRERAQSVASTLTRNNSLSAMGTALTQRSSLSVLVSGSKSKQRKSVTVPLTTNSDAKSALDLSHNTSGSFRPDSPSSDSSSILSEDALGLNATSRSDGEGLNDTKDEIEAGGESRKLARRSKGLNPVASLAEWFGVPWAELEAELSQTLISQVDQDPEHLVRYHTLSSLSVPQQYTSNKPLSTYEPFKVTALNLQPSQFIHGFLKKVSFRVTKKPEVVKSVQEAHIVQAGALRPLRNAPGASGRKRGSDSQRGTPMDGSPVDQSLSSVPSPSGAGHGHSSVPSPSGAGHGRGRLLSTLPGGAGASVGPGLLSHAVPSMIMNKGYGARGANRLHRQTSMTSMADGLSVAGGSESDEDLRPINAAEVFKTPVEIAEEVRAKLKKEHGLDNAMIYRRMPFLNTFGWEWLTNLDSLHNIIRSSMSDPHVALAFAMSSADGVFYGTICTLHWCFEFNKDGTAFTEGKFVPIPLPYPVSPTLADESNVKSPGLKRVRQSGGMDASFADDASVALAMDSTMTSKSRQRQSRVPRSVAGSRGVTPSMGGNSGGNTLLVSESTLTKKHSSAFPKDNSRAVSSCASECGVGAEDSNDISLLILNSKPVTQETEIDPFFTFPCLLRMEHDSPSLDFRAAAKALSNVMLQCQTQDLILGSIEKHMARAVDPVLPMKQRKEAHLQAVCGLERYVLLLLYHCFLLLQKTILQLMANGEQASFRDFVFSTNSKVVAFLNTLDPWEARELSPAEAEAMPYPPQAGQLRTSQRWRRNDWMPNIG